MESNNNNRNVARTVTTYGDLPEKFTFVHKSEDYGIPENLKAYMGMIALGGDKIEKPTDIWLVATEKYFGSLDFFNVIRAIGRKGLNVKKELKIDEGLLQALYDKSNTKTKSSIDEETSKFITAADIMIGDGLKEKVSDVHIEKRKSQAIIRMRKHGELFEYKDISPTYALQLCTVMYNVMAENKEIVFSENDYQAAAINRVINGQEVKLRYQSLPVYPDGFDVVLRLLPIGSDDEQFVPLDHLGYTGNQVQTLLSIVAKPVGALVIAGTTGSGKSTTLKNLLMFANANAGYRKKIFTVEDPPEYKIPKVSQIPVVRRKTEDYTKKSPFEDPLTATMRGDPDILMIGEVRDKFTSDGLKKAAQSGHQVMSTTHAASALGTIDRFTDFGLTPSVLGSPDFLTGLCYQKLVPIICQSCSKDFKEILASSKADREALAIAKRIEVIVSLEKYNIRVKGNGCPKCKMSGISGRTVCSEIIAPDFNLLKFFKDQDSVGALRYWRSLSDDNLESDNQTGKTAFEHALSKMIKGMVSPYDVESCFGPIDNAVNVVKREQEKERNKNRVKSKGNKEENGGGDEEWNDF